jgi:integrase
MELIDTIKSVRIYAENGVIKGDYHTSPGAKLPKGKKGNRFRFSTGMEASKINLKRVELNKFELALKRYELLFDPLECKSELLFEDIASKALAEAASDRRKHDGTKDYENILKNDVLPTFGKMALKEIKASHIKAWQVKMGERKISQSRFNKIYYVFKRGMDFAAENGYIDLNPIGFVKRSSKMFSKPKSKENDYFSAAEREIILNDTCQGCTAKEMADHAFINPFMHVAFLAGGRTGEIMALTWDDIDFENKTITFRTSIRRGVLDVTKTDESRTLPMVERLETALLKWKGDRTRKYVFPNPRKGTPYSDSRTIVDHKYKPMLKRLGIPFKILYNGRSTFASLAFEKGVSMLTVSKCLGHKNIATTQRYYIRMGNVDHDTTRAELESLAM